MLLRVLIAGHNLRRKVDKMIDCQMKDCEYLENGRYCRFDREGVLHIRSGSDGPICCNYESVKEALYM